MTRITGSWMVPKTRPSSPSGGSVVRILVRCGRDSFRVMPAGSQDTSSKGPTTSSRGRRGALARTWGPPLLLVFVPVFLVSLHVHAYTKLSPIDELQHVDYMFRSPGIHPVIAGTLDSEPAMREEACRGIEAVFTLPPCSAKTLVPSEFQDQGYDTAYIHPPTYYDVTWAAGEVLKGATGAKSWVTVWRLVGALWLAAGLLLTYSAGLRMGASRLPLVGLLLLLASAPSILQTNSTVTPDAASTFVGGAVLYLACRWERGGKWRWTALVGIGFVGTAFKIQDAIVVMMIAIYFLLRAKNEPATGISVAAEAPGSTALTESNSAPVPAGGLRLATRPSVGLLWNTWTKGVGILVITSGAIAAAWTVLQRVTETINPNNLLVNKQFVVSSISLQEIASTFGVFLAPVPGAYIPASTQNVWTTDAVSVLSWLLIAGVVGGALFVARTRALAALARATLIAALFGGPIFVVLNFLTMSQYIPMPTRYGFTLLPGMVVCTADAVRARWVGVCVMVAAALSVVAVATRLI